MKGVPDRLGGNIITTLLIFLLRKGIIDECLVVGMSKKKPWKAVPLIAKCEEDVLRASGSKYVFVPYHKIVKKLKKKSAVVALPCQSRILPHTVIKLGLFCGSSLSYNA